MKARDARLLTQAFCKGPKLTFYLARTDQAIREAAMDGRRSMEIPGWSDLDEAVRDTLSRHYRREGFNVQGQMISW